MRLGFITPTAYINKFGLVGDITLALAHLIDPYHVNQYEDAIKRCGLPIYLDNGVFENSKSEGIDSLINKALRIRAKYLFAPDTLYRSEETKRGVEIMDYILKRRRVRDKIKIGAVVQADNPNDWLNQYKDFCNMKEVDLIGLSILSIPMAFKKRIKTEEITKNRLYCLEQILKLDIQHKDCHLLGLGESYDDILFAKKNCPWIKSNDTSSCFVHGYNGVRYKKDLTIPGGKISQRLDFNIKDLTIKQEKDIEYNINLVLKCLK